ncbi:MAG: methionyl-tRNA formyltransferase [Christensenellales bacterium]
MRIAFLGTPDFALPSLKMLVDEGYDICAVFCQPDRPVGRSKKPVFPPVKAFAVERGIPVFQPEKIRLPKGQAMLRQVAPDLMITAAFGQILSAENLSVPPLGCINVHGSLLPKYRGAAPVQWAVINGERVTGVTTMFTDVGLDTGDMLLKREIEILPNETAGELFDRVAELGAQVLKDTLIALQNGTLTRIKQDESQATKCRMLKKEDGHVDFFLPAQRVHDLIRGVDPWPGAFAYFEGTPIKFWGSRVTEGSGKPGEILVADGKNGLVVAAGEGAVRIGEIQAPGGKRMEACAYLRGKTLPVGGQFA